MSVLTKVFIVLLVVVSLLTSAGLIVFVNQTEVFRLSLKTAQDAKAAADAQNAALKANASAAQADANSARKERDDMAIELAKAGDPYKEDIAKLKSDLAAAQAQLSVANISVASTTAALTSSEAQRTAQAKLLADARTDNDKLNKQNSDESLAISDLTNKLEVANFKVKEFTEMDAQDKAEAARLAAIIKDKFGPLALQTSGDKTGITGGAPTINGVVRSVSSPDGIAHATISVGSDEDVKVGMKFYVIDLSKPANQAFLGVMTVDSVDAKEATGRLDGPNVPAVKPGVEVRTHLVG